MSKLQTRTLYLGPELSLSYAEQGNSSGPAVVLLHGYSDSWPSYMPLMAKLPVSFRVVAISMRGHGDSSKPPRGYGTASFAADVAAAMDKLRIPEATIVGHSMGSLVAQRFAIDYPSRVSKLVLIGAFETLKGNAALESLWRQDVAQMRDPVDPAFVRDFQLSSLANTIAADFLEGVISESLKLPALVWRRTLRALLNESHADRLREITVPTLLLWGDRDAFTGRFEQDVLARKICRSQLAILASTGHAPHWEHPDYVAGELVAFINAHDHLAA